MYSKPLHWMKDKVNVRIMVSQCERRELFQHNSQINWRRTWKEKNRLDENCSY